MLQEGKDCGLLPDYCFHCCQLAPPNVIRRLSDSYTDSAEKYSCFLPAELGVLWFNVVRYAAGEPYVRKVWTRKVQLFLADEW